MWDLVKWCFIWY